MSNNRMMNENLDCSADEFDFNHLLRNQSKLWHQFNQTKSKAKSKPTYIKSVSSYKSKKLDTNYNHYRGSANRGINYLETDEIYRFKKEEK